MCRGDGQHRGDERREQGFSQPDCRGASISSGVDCRAGRRATWPFAPLDGCAAAIALDVELKDGRVVDEAIDGGEGHGGVWEDPVPLAEGLVGSDQEGSSLVPGADQLEEHAGLGLVLGDVGEVVEDQQMVLVELGDGGFQGKFASGDLKALHQVGGSGEEHAPAVLDQAEADGGGQVAFSAAARSRVIMPATTAVTAEYAIVFIHFTTKPLSLRGASGTAAPFF